MNYVLYSNVIKPEASSRYALFTFRASFAHCGTGKLNFSTHTVRVCVCAPDFIYTKRPKHRKHAILNFMRILMDKSEHRRTQKWQRPATVLTDF